MKRVLAFLVVSAALFGQQPIKRNLGCQAVSGSGTAYTCSIASAPSSYVVGERYFFKADVSNTGAATITFNSLSAVPVVKLVAGVSTAMAAGDIQAGEWVSMIYDGANMQKQLLPQAPADWNASSGPAQILNKPTLTTVATSGSYLDLSNLPGFVNSLTSFNTAYGFSTLPSTATGAKNTALGAYALPSNTTGTDNTAVGYASLNANIAGLYSTAVGSGALNTTTGNANAGVGYYALHTTSSGTNNTAMGAYAGYGSSANANTTGANNTFLGYAAAPGSSTQQTYMTVIGAGATGTCSNCVVLGRSADTVQVPGSLTSTGTVNGVSAATMAFLDPTSSVQAQLNAKQTTISGAPGTWPSTFTPPAPGVSTLGGVNSKDCSSGSQMIQKINTDGSITCASQTARLADPGSNGMVKRTSLNTTATAVDGTDFVSPSVLNNGSLAGYLASIHTSGDANIDGNANVTNILSAGTAYFGTAGAQGCVYFWDTQSTPVGHPLCAVSGGLTLSGTALMTVSTSLLAAQMPALTGDVNNSAGSLGTIVGKIHETSSTITYSQSPYTALSTDSLILCNATGGAITVNLPAATGSNRTISVRKTDSSANVCTATPNGTDTIDGGSSGGSQTQFATTRLQDTASGVWSRINVVSQAGDVTGNTSASKVTKLNGTSLAGLGTGLLKNTTGTGIPTIAVPGTDYVTPGTIGGQVCTTSTNTYTGDSTDHAIVSTSAFPANTFNAQTSFRVKAHALHSNTGGTGTVILKTKIGGTVVATMTATTNATLATNAPYWVEGNATIQTTGSSGTMWGWEMLGATSGSGVTSAFAIASQASGLTTAAVNTTTTNVVELDFYSATSAISDVFDYACVEVVKP